MTSGLARFGRPTALTCNLGTSGTLAAHTPGAAYSGTFSVTNRVGDVTAELVSATPALPAGWTLAVNQATGVVTLAWPAAAPVSAPPLPNLGFEAGAASWLLGNGWDVTAVGPVDAGTQSAKYNGPGQATIRHAQAVPVTPGTSITASARISKGANRQDFAGGAVVLEWLTAAGAPLSFSVGNVVNTGSSAFQTSTVTASAPAGAGLVRLGISGTRDIKGRAIDRVYADTVTWSHTYTLPGAPVTAYSVVIRVRDGRGCQATLSQTVVSQTLNVVALLHFDGANGSTVFADEVSGNVWAREGQGPVISTAQSKFGGSSVSFNRASGNRLINRAPVINFADDVQVATDFCIECWVRADSSGGSDAGIFSLTNVQADTAFSVIISADRTAIVRTTGIAPPVGVWISQTTATVPVNQWAHVALTREGTTLRLFIDGVLAGSGVYARTQQGGALSIGAVDNAGGNLLGFVDEFRVVKGSAVYTENFTPPNAPFTL